MDKRDQIIEVATRLFSERGFENTPLSLVCETANVSKGLIFHHFKSKNHLLREIFSKTTQLIVEINTPQKADLPARERLVAMLDSFFAQLKQDKMLVQLNLNMILQPNTREILNDLVRERSSIVLNSVRPLFDEIAPEKAEVVTYLLIAELDGIALHYLCIFDGYPLDEIQKNLMNKYAAL